MWMFRTPPRDQMSWMRELWLRVASPFKQSTMPCGAPLPMRCVRLLEERGDKRREKGSFSPRSSLAREQNTSTPPSVPSQTLGQGARTSSSFVCFFRRTDQQHFVASRAMVKKDTICVILASPNVSSVNFTSQNQQ